MAKPKPTTETKMTTITIDNKEYDLDTLSEEAKAQLVSIQFVDQELQRVNAQAAVLQTARVAYAKALNEALGADLVFNS
jgi:cell division protein ZapA (FtsZ GTPase activity inhibitor)